MRDLKCAVCAYPAPLWATVDGYDFTQCDACGSIALDADAIAEVDEGKPLRGYDADYWRAELISARERAWGGSLARAAEAIYLCQRPIKAFVDIGSGDGSLLDALSYQLPSFRERIFGVERFPPEQRTAHPGYWVGQISQAPRRFDCGVCIEVVEHLTPRMLDALIAGLAARSNENSCFVFNTGLGDYVVKEDAGYIDPLRRGHIVAYGLPALSLMFARHHFRVSALGARSWAFVAEYRPTSDFDLDHRTWHPLPDNQRILSDPISGSLMSIAARESLRTYR